MSKSSKMPPVNDAAGMKRWHNERGIPWGTTYDGPDPLVVRRMVPAGTRRLHNLNMHLANEHGINSDKALRGSEVEHMWAHLVAAFRPGQEHYHGDVPEPEPGKGDVGDSDCPAKPAGVPLEWHDGVHYWDTHDGYPRHQHSLNGNLTISPKSTRLHFKGSTFEDEAEL